MGGRSGVKRPDQRALTVIYSVVGNVCFRWLLRSLYLISQRTRTNMRGSGRALQGVVCVLTNRSQDLVLQRSVHYLACPRSGFLIIFRRRRTKHGLHLPWTTSAPHLPSTVSMPGNRITTFRASAHALYCILTVFCITIDCMCTYIQQSTSSYPCHTTSRHLGSILDSLSSSPFRRSSSATVRIRNWCCQKYPPRHRGLEANENDTLKRTPLRTIRYREPRHQSLVPVLQ